MTVSLTDIAQCTSWTTDFEYDTAFQGFVNLNFQWWLCTLREEIFAGINFRNFLSFGAFAGINFRELSLTKDFAGINFRESALIKDFAGVNLTFAFRNIFSATLVYGFENNLSKN